MNCTVGLTGADRFEGVAGGARRVASDGIRLDRDAGWGEIATAGALGIAAMVGLEAPAED
jgi:hypothetical protein